MKQILRLILILFFHLVVLTYLNAQSEFESTVDSVTLYIYIVGKPDLNYVKAKKNIAKSIGLRTEFFFVDCEGKFEYKATEFKLKNVSAFKKLEDVYGNNWNEKFESEIANAINKIR